MINFLKNLFKKQTCLTKEKFKNRYGLDQDDIDFFYYLSGLNQEDEAVALSGFMYLIFKSKYNINKDIIKFNSELKIFLTEVYEKQTEFYKTIINVSDFQMINEFLDKKNYVCSCQHLRQIEKFNQQVKQITCLFKEIKQLYPVQTKECNLEEQLAKHFFDFEKYEQLKLKFPFIQYVDLNEYIDKNQIFMVWLKNIRFNGFPKPESIYENNIKLYDYIKVL